MYAVMQRLPIYDNRDAVVGTKTSRAHEYNFQTFGLANFVANSLAADCWHEIDIYVADVAKPNIPVHQCPPSIPEDDDIAF